MFFILLFGLLALLFAALVLTLRQPMLAALALIAHMVSLAAVYACLGAHVVAIFQVLIYVGAVMVFMVYTIMLLDDRDGSFSSPFSATALPGLAVTSLIVAAIWYALPSGSQTVSAVAADIFSFKAFSVEFMKRYWLHFELATILLVVGVVAAWTAVVEGQRG
jgi:NADH-quinone oxidoreductase subunit J